MRIIDTTTTSSSVSRRKRVVRSTKTHDEDEPYRAPPVCMRKEEAQELLAKKLAKLGIQGPSFDLSITTSVAKHPAIPPLTTITAPSQVIMCCGLCLRSNYAGSALLHSRYDAAWVAVGDCQSHRFHRRCVEDWAAVFGRAGEACVCPRC